MVTFSTVLGGRLGGTIICFAHLLGDFAICLVTFDLLGSFDLLGNFAICLVVFDNF